MKYSRIKIGNIYVDCDIEDMPMVVKRIIMNVPEAKNIEVKI